MPFVRVRNYQLGYSIPNKQFYFYYELEGDSTVDSQDFIALAEMFRKGVPVDFNTEGQYFVTANKKI